MDDRTKSSASFPTWDLLRESHRRTVHHVAFFLECGIHIRHDAGCMTTPAVSLLVTVYNRERFLSACLQSIVDSTFDDFEIVIVDDGSTDASVRIAEDWTSKDSR